VSEDLKIFIGQIAEGKTLSVKEAEQAFNVIMSGDAQESQISAFLMGLRMRGETVAEITGAVRTIRAKAAMIFAPTNAMDIVGTGGDGAGTYNISTGTAFVVAGCGVPVAKHGNRSVSSKSGASDVLSVLGVNLNAEFSLIEKAITHAGIGFMMAPRHHSAMRFVGPVRAAMGVRTIFNILGPLSNPAGVKRQFTGVYAKELMKPMARTLQIMGCEATWIVHGSDGLDEMTTTGPTRVVALKEGKISQFDVSPKDAGLPLSCASDLEGGTAEVNGAAILTLLAGEKGPFRDIVVFNAAASLIVAGKVDDLKQGVAQAQAAIDDGKAQAALDGLIKISNSNA
jgi:anthranilate phosphoribosyltransferase